MTPCGGHVGLGDAGIASHDVSRPFANPWLRSFAPLLRARGVVVEGVLPSTVASLTLAGAA